MKQTSGYNKLLNKLDAFTRKYYLNKLLRGGILWIGLVLIFYLAISLLESQFWFHSGVRQIMFYSFLAISIVAAVFWMGFPIARYLKLGKQISHEQAANIIGNHFSEVQDKLLNILQLNEQASKTQDNTLVLASIEQKTEDIQLVNFPKAIDLSQNKRYLKYALPPLALLLILIIAAPQLITDSTERLINNNKEYEKPAPFQFELKQKNLEVVQFSDINLNVSVDGEYLPEDVEVLVDDYPYNMRKNSRNEFSHQIKNIQSDKTIQFQSGKVKSKLYKIDVIGKPSIESFKIKMNYPAYIGKKDEIIKNTGDVIIPAGTEMQWIFSTRNTDKLNYVTTQMDSMGEAEKSPNIAGEYILNHKALNQLSYTFYVSGNKLNKADSVTYNVSTIPDNYPNISVEKFQDSTINDPIYFVGEATDDYGISSLYFKYYKIDAEGKKGKVQSRRIDIDRGQKIGFEDIFKINEIELKAGEQLNYYYQVFDNDAVNGPKSARTSIMTVEKPTKEEYEKREEENEESITSNLEQAFKQNEKLKKEIEKLRNKMLSQKDVEWQDKKTLEELMKKQKKIQEQIKRAKEKFEENLQNQKEFDKPSEETQKKQEQLKELFKKAEKKSEVEKMLEKLKELMQELNKDKSLEMMDEMKKNQSEQDLDLDRLKELYKKLELERDLQQQMEKLNELSEKQDELRNETEKIEKTEQKSSENNKSQEQESKSQEKQEQLKKKQDDINKEFDKIKKEIEKAVEKNKKLTKPKDIGDPEQKMHNIQDDLNKSKQNLDQNQNKKASEKMKNASEKMKQMAEEMESGMQSSSAQQMKEDLESLRQLLENLVTISFDQEEILEKFRNTDPHTPRYVENVQRQFKIQQDFTIVEDSLRALSKRVFQLKPYIMEKVSEVNDNMEKSIGFLEEREVSVANNHQQRIMKAVNDLAVMLSETMEKMQQQMSQQMKGNQMCNNPKPGASNPSSSGKKPMNKISEGQKKLSEKMKEMAEENMKKGKSGKGGMSSEEYAKMAKQQAQLRKMLEEYNENLREKGQGQQSLEDIMKQMNENEKDLVNKRLTNEMLKRQQDIVTRLLEAKNAERQRKMSEKRKAETAKSEKEKEVPPALAEYLQKRKSEIEALKSVSPSLKPFYKALVDEYYQSARN